jgi:hypothetical protein
MKKLVRDHRTVGVEIARSQVEVEGRSIPVVLYQTAPESTPQVLLGNSGLVNVTPVDAEKYFISKFFETMSQALYFGLERSTIEDLAKEALERSERYVQQAQESQKVPVRS